MIVGLAAVPAGAAIGQPTARLTVTPAGPGYYNVQVSGTVRMTQGEAQALINSGHRVVVRLNAQPVGTISDDELAREHSGVRCFKVISPRWSICCYGKTCWAEILTLPADWHHGLKFTAVLRAPGRVLNVNLKGRDTISAEVRLVNARRQTVRLGRTNQVVGTFGADQVALTTSPAAAFRCAEPLALAAVGLRE